jgi:uncharacterized membrane protein YidH (DUF202 family)
MDLFRYKLIVILNLIIFSCGIYQVSRTHIDSKENNIGIIIILISVCVFLLTLINYTYERRKKKTEGYEVIIPYPTYDVDF